MEFWQEAPFMVTDEGGGDYFLDWAVLPANVGYTQAEVEAQIAAILGDSAGWEQAGVTSRHNPSTPSVVFEVVTEAEGESNEAARTFWGEFPVRVSLEYAWLNDANLGWNNLVNHESGHAFFSGTHEGSPGIMNMFSGDRPDWPNADDIQSVIGWLSDTPDTGEPGGGTADTGGTYWFPADLPDYMTRWAVPADHEARITVNVRRGVTGARLKGLWGHSTEAMLEGRVHEMTPALSAASEGLYASEWLPVSEGGDLYVGIVVRRQTTAVDPTNLRAFCEVQIRRSA